MSTRPGVGPVSVVMRPSTGTWGRWHAVVPDQRPVVPGGGKGKFTTGARRHGGWVFLKHEEHEE
jgi:hypothetical protein